MSGRSDAPGECGRCTRVLPGVLVDPSEDQPGWLCHGCAEALAQGSRGEEQGTAGSEDCGVVAGSARASGAEQGQDAEQADAAEVAGEPEVEELLRLAAAGDLQPVAVELPPLPPGSSPAVRKVAEFFALVRGLRLAVCDQRDVPFAGRWVARYVGLPERSVYRVLEVLRAAGVLERAGSLPRGPRRSYGTALYVPGALPSAPVSVEGRPKVVCDALQPEVHLRDESLVFATEDAAVERLPPAVGSRAVVAVHAVDATPQVGGARASTDDDPGAWRDG